MTFRKYLCNVKLCMKEFLQTKYIMIIHTLLLFLTTSLPAILQYSNIKNRSWGVEEWELENIAHYLSGRSEFLMIIIPAAAFVITYFSFSYLYRMRSAVFYGSMPRKRSCIYLTKYVSSCISAVIPYIIISVVNFVLIGVYDLNVDTGEFFARAAFCILQYVLLISAFSFAASISGNVFAQIISTGFMFLVYPVTYLVISGVISTNFVTYSMNFSLDECYIFPWVAISRPIIELKYVVFGIIVTLILLALGLLAYVKRRTENTEKFFAYRFINVILKYYVSAIAAVVGGIAIGEIAENGLLATYLGCLFFGFLAFCIIQGIFEKSFKAMFSNLKGFAILGIISVVLITIPTADPFGLEKYIPELKSVKLGPVDNHAGYYIRSNGGIELTSEENLKATEKLLKAGIETSLEYKRLADMGVNPYKQERYMNSKNMELYLNNNNFGITRELSHVPYEVFYEFAKTVYDTKEYKNGYIAFINNTCKPISFNVSKNGYCDTISLYNDGQIDSKIVNELVEIVTDDIKTFSFADVEKSSVYCDIDFHGDVYVSVPVYSCYENTIKYLKDNVLVDRTSTFKGNSLKFTYTDGEGTTEEFYVNDKDAIHEIIKNTGYQYNSFTHKNAKFYSVYGGDTGEYIGEISEDLLPENLEKVFVTAEE